MTRLAWTLAALGANLGCGSNRVDVRSADAGGDGAAADARTRPRVLVEGAIGQGGDDDASLVRFLLYADQWQLEGILTPSRPGVLPHLAAYRQAWPRLRGVSPDYPSADELERRIVATDESPEPAVRLVRDRLGAEGAGALWYLRWSAPARGGPSILRQALDRLQAEESGERHRRLLGELRVIGDGDALEPHRQQLGLVIDTLGAEAAGAAALNATPGFDLARDVLGSGSPLAPLYPPQAQERSSLTFLYLVTNGLSPAHEPRWTTWAGRFVPDGSGLASAWTAAPEPGVDGAPGGAAIIASLAGHMQNDFLARLARSRAEGANAPGNREPRPVLTARKPPGEIGDLDMSGEATGSEPLFVAVVPGQTLVLDASDSSDPEGQALTGHWWIDVAASSFGGSLELSATEGLTIDVRIPESFPERQNVHLLLAITDRGQPALTRYRRIILTRPR